MTDMNFERLPNELLSEVFGYLHALDLFQAFNGLNERFDQLLIQLPSHHVNFHGASRVQFNDLCRDHLPRIAPHIRSVYLLGGELTPMLPENFLAHGFTLDQFVQLRSVTLSFIPSSRSLDQMISQCLHLAHLERLRVIPSLRLYKYELFNQIWKLPTLKSCTIGLKCFDESEFLKLTTVSRSIKQLTLNGAALQLDALVNIFRHTPELKHLQVGFVGRHNRPTVDSLLLCLTSLHLSYTSNSTAALIALFQQMPNLRRMKLDINRVYVDGRAWEKIIDTHLPLLECFQLKMEFQALYSVTREEVADHLLANFQSSFYLKHKWFVRLEWSDDEINHLMRLSTISYPFHEYIVHRHLRSKSTLPQDHDHLQLSSAIRVTNLDYFDDPSTPLQPFISSFRGVRHLTTMIPCCDALLATIPLLDQLSSLQIDRLVGECASAQLQLILDRAPRVGRLIFPNSEYFDVELFELKSHSVRELVFRGNLRWNQEQCIKLATSPLGQQCRSLVIEVETLECVAELIDRMAKLRFLKLCQSNRGETEFLPLLKDKFPQISWTACEGGDALSVRGWIR